MANSHMNQNDRDLLIELKTQMAGVRDDIKDLKDNSSARIANIEQNSVSKIVVDDHETRLRFLEKYTWITIGALTIINLAITIGMRYYK